MASLGVLGLLAGGKMYISVLPVDPEQGALAMLWGGLFAVVAVALALSDRKLLRFPLLLWCAAVTVTLISAVFRSGFRFDGFENFVAIGIAALISLLFVWGSWAHLVAPNR